MASNSSSLLILGIDPSLSSIPDLYKENDCDILSWGEDVINECCPYISGVEFQSAYFENLGLNGLVALSKLIKVAKQQGLSVIMDAKRGDIGSTSLAYASAYLSKKNAANNTDFESDYLTVNPLMGEDCIQPFIDVAIENKKGIFVLLETSNSGASMILKQQTRDNTQVNEKIAEFIQKQHNKMNLSEDEIGPIGCVIGATNEHVHHWRRKLPNSIFLMPGIGAQGGSWESVKSCLNNSNQGVLIPISRGVTKAEVPSLSSKDYLDSVRDKISDFHNKMEEILL